LCICIKTKQDFILPEGYDPDSQADTEVLTISQGRNKFRQNDMCDGTQRMSSGIARISKGLKAGWEATVEGGNQ
jgi:hypothetical protein